jgi:alpha-aminoadipic semialdehyde synthase
LAPFIIGITGHGNASRGVQDILSPLAPIEVHPRDMKRFIRHQQYVNNRVYKIVLFREEKLRARNGKGFYFEEYLEHPERFESNLDKYLPYLNMLVHTSYWDERYPRLVTKKMIRKLYGKKNFRLEMIVDISCDINGSVELTREARSPGNPVYTYEPGKDEFADGYKAKGITLLSVDNLPAELPVNSSREFSAMIRDYVYQISAHGVKDITDHIAIPREVRKAVITQDGRFAKGYEYLKKHTG